MHVYFQVEKNTALMHKKKETIPKDSLFNRFKKK